MTERWHLGGMGHRLLAALLIVSLASLSVLAVGTVGPHLLARTGRHEEIDTGWLLAATAIAVLTAIALSVVVAQRLAEPIHTIIRQTRAFAAGDHTVRLPDLRRPELTELVDTLNAAAEEVEGSEQNRRRLTADIAHELRTPLTVLQAGLEELRDGYVPPERATLEALHAQAARLGRVVADLSDLADAETAGLHLVLGPVDLGSVARTALEQRAHGMATAGLVVRKLVDADVLVTADADRLHQVVDNLLANCTAYCRSGDTVEVRVCCEDARGVIEVADSGPGIDEIERVHVFDRRWRGVSSGTTAGSGLGLPIVQALVVAQGGTVRVRAAEPSGTVVRVELPLEEGTPGAGQTSAPPEA